MASTTFFILCITFLWALAECAEPGKSRRRTTGRRGTTSKNAGRSSTRQPAQNGDDKDECKVIVGIAELYGETYKQTINLQFPTTLEKIKQIVQDLDFGVGLIDVSTPTFTESFAKKYNAHTEITYKSTFGQKLCGGWALYFPYSLATSTSTVFVLDNELPPRSRYRGCLVKLTRVVTAAQMLRLCVEDLTRLGIRPALGTPILSVYDVYLKKKTSHILSDNEMCLPAMSVHNWRLRPHYIKFVENDDDILQLPIKVQLIRGNDESAIGGFKYKCTIKLLRGSSYPVLDLASACASDLRGQSNGENKPDFEFTKKSFCVIPNLETTSGSLDANQQSFTAEELTAPGLSLAMTAVQSTVIKFEHSLMYVDSADTLRCVWPGLTVMELRSSLVYLRTKPGAKIRVERRAPRLDKRIHKTDGDQLYDELHTGEPAHIILTKN